MPTTTIFVAIQPSNSVPRRKVHSSHIRRQFDCTGDYTIHQVRQHLFDIPPRRRPETERERESARARRLPQASNIRRLPRFQFGLRGSERFRYPKRSRAPGCVWASGSAGRGLAFASSLLAASVLRRCRLSLSLLGWFEIKNSKQIANRLFVLQSSQSWVSLATPATSAPPPVPSAHTTVRNNTTLESPYGSFA